ncbi:MAG: DUF2927 domain-containing protein [Paracoccaceae bacterium]
MILGVCARVIKLCLGLTPVLLALAGCADLDRTPNYANIAQNLQAKGHLRTDTAPADARVTLPRLSRTFEDVVFQYEFHFKDGKMVNERIAKPLKRWRGNIRYKFTGDAVTAQDRSDVRDLTTEISALTGLTFQQVDGRHDMLISIATRKGRRDVSKALGAARMPTYRKRYDLWRRTPSWVCGATLSADHMDAGRLIFAHVFMGAEVTGLLRKACLHEEIVQALGLTNDSDAARPSIFNDDQEFALMTEHDAMLLRALYDPRLRPGMSADEAMPTVRQVLSRVMSEQMRAAIDTPAGGPSPG